MATMRRADLLERVKDAARLAKVIPEPITYALGKGGFDPARHVPWNRAGECDCSGFGAWAMAEPRELKAIAGGWIESTMVHADATGPQKVFRILGGAERAMPGDFLVAPDRDGKQGHVAVITEVAADGRVHRITDCSPANDVSGPAIADRVAPAHFVSRAIVVRPRKLID